MNKIYTYFFSLLVVALLVGCSGANSKSSNVEAPFIIKSIDSFIIPLNDTASKTQLNGVQYQVSLFSSKKIQPENYSSYKFEIISSSVLNENLGPLKDLSLTNTYDEGYLYNLIFESVYRDYSEEDLESLLNEKDFKIVVEHNGKKYTFDFE